MPPGHRIRWSGGDGCEDWTAWCPSPFSEPSQANPAAGGVEVEVAGRNRMGAMAAMDASPGVRTRRPTDP